MSKPSQTITLSLHDFIWLALGHEMRGTCQLPLDVAVVVHTLTKDGLRYYVQFTDEFEEPLEYPLLWSYPEWQESETRRQKAKQYSEQQRDESFMRDENIKLVAKHLESTLFMDSKTAQATANVLVRRGKVKNIKALGVKKLIETKEELNKIEIRSGSTFWRNYLK